MHRLSVVLCAAVALVCLAPTSAEAGRKVRLMYEAPIAGAGGPAVAVTFQNAREEKKGGAELPLIAQERGSYGIPSGIFSGAKKTEHADVVVANWAADALRSGGYDARVGEDPTLPRVHVQLMKLWGDGMGPHLQFAFGANLQIFEPGGTEPVWEGGVQASQGVQNVIRLSDPFEDGFSQVFAEGTKGLLALMLTPEFQAALPGADPAAIANAEGLFGNREATLAADKEMAGEAGASAASVEGNLTNCTDDGKLPKGWETFDYDVYCWGGKSLIGSYVMGGVGVGLTIAGDQIARNNTERHRGVTLPVVFSTLSSVQHIPDSGPDDIDAGVAVQGMVSELVFVYGLQTVVPVFGGIVPGHIAAASGADIQTMKALTGIASLPAMAPAGITHLVRFGRDYVPQLQQKNAEGDNERILHVPMAVVSLAAGIADLVVGGVQFGFGIAYATGKITADPREKGIVPNPQMESGRMQNRGAVRFLMVPTIDGGVAFSAYGTF